jgi:glutamate dehydrogenase/leucine dehydrogenase
MDVLDQIEAEFFDEYGPAKLIHLHEPRVGLKAIVCIHNTAIGPAIGGLRMAPRVTTKEVYLLAQTMTFKNAAAGIRYGGAKSGIVADPRQPEEKRESIIRAFAKAIKELTDYIPGPDMGTNEASMGYIFDETGRAVGLPRSLGGIPLNEIGATGYGVFCCVEVAAEYAEVDLSGARVAVEGYGAVGQPAARFLCNQGAVLVAASDSKGTIYEPNGIDPEALSQHKKGTGSVIGFGKGKTLNVEAGLEVECDILIPAARPDAIHEGNWDRVQSRIVVCGANIPMSEEIERRLQDKGVLLIPDVVANAGGVICGAFEYQGGSEEDVFPMIKRRIQANTRSLLDQVSRNKGYARAVALEMARARVKDAMKYRFLH